MSEKEIKDIWNGSGDDEEINVNLAQLESNLKAKSKKMDRTLFWRDSREIIGAVVVMIFFSYQAMSESLFITKITSILFVLWAIYVSYRLLDVRKYKRVVDLSNSFKAQLLQQKLYLEQQAQLLDSILTWYVGPFALIYSLRIIGNALSNDPLWVIASSIMIKLAMVFLFSWGLYALNKKAAKKGFSPLIENIDRVLIQLDEDSI